MVALGVQHMPENSSLLSKKALRAAVRRASDMETALLDTVQIIPGFLLVRLAAFLYRALAVRRSVYSAIIWHAREQNGCRTVTGRSPVGPFQKL